MRAYDEQIVVELLYQLGEELPVANTPAVYKILKPILRDHGIKIGRDAVHEIRARHGLLHRKRRKTVRTTNSYHRFRKYTNQIKGLEIVRSEQVFVSDITYLRVGDGFNFLSLVSDAYSRKIMGYCLHPTLEAEGCIRALQMSMGHRSFPSVDLIHHSDRGIQYCCDDYITLLSEYNIIPSMTENSDPRENAIAERLNGILKKNFALKQTFADADVAQEAVAKAVKNYNELRPHSSVSMLTPAAAHLYEGELKRMWKPKIYESVAPL